MNKIKMLLLYALAVGFVLLPCGCEGDKKAVTGEKDFSGVYGEMYAPDFWIKDGYDKQLLSAEDIVAVNKEIKNTKASGLADMYAYDGNWSEEEILKRINAFGLPNKALYTGANADTVIGGGYLRSFENNRNIKAVAPITKGGYAVAVRETEVRDFPDSTPVYEERGNPDIDIFCENRMRVWEKCFALHRSADGKWAFVQGDSFSGWVLAEDIAECTVDDWRKADETAFLVVTGNGIVTGDNPYNSKLSQVYMMMGTKIPLANGKEEIDGVATVGSYCGVMPLRNKEGKLETTNIAIPKSLDVYEGYLPYTKENIIKQAFKVLGERYGWGGSLNAKDCSSYIRCVYWCFGIDLPKNSAGQGSVPGAVKKYVENTDAESKERETVMLNPGAIIEMKGHVMMYLGEYEGKAYVIHDVYAYGESGGNGERRTVNCVTVSDLYVTRKNGRKFIEDVRTLTDFAK